MAHLAHLDKITGLLAIGLGILALAAGLSTDAYSYGAQAEARVDKVLTHYIAHGDDTLCLNDATASDASSQTEAVTQ